jgi:hypothetical protein
MLRITVQNAPKSTTFKLEGTLVGPWVQEAKDCWRRALPHPAEQAICFDLAGLTSIDAAGRAFLSAMHSEGAELVACGCLMRAVIAELKQAPVRGCGCSEGARNDLPSK